MKINDINEMTSSRPYLLKALNEWILDNKLTPHVVVDATKENVVVPLEYVESGRIVLNLSPSAVNLFEITNEFITFSARFSGKSMEIFIPVSSVLALYAKENGQGMVFNDEKQNIRADKISVASSQLEKKKKTVTRPNLKLV